MSRPEGMGDTAAVSRVNGADVSETPLPSFAALFDDYSPAVYGLAMHILGDNPAAEAVAEEVFVRAWRVGVDTWAESADSREPEGRCGSDRAMSWLLRLTHALAGAGLKAAVESQAPKKPGDGPAANATELPGLGMYDEALSPEQRCLLGRILWHGTTIGALAREMGRTPLEIAQDVRAAIARVQ